MFWIRHTTFPKVWGILGGTISALTTVILSSRHHVRHLYVEKHVRSWHQDSGRVNIEIESSPSPRYFKVSIGCLTVQKQEEYNLYFLPGSHLWDTFERPKDGSLHGATPVCCKPGDAVFFDRRIWHARMKMTLTLHEKGFFMDTGTDGSAVKTI